MLIGGARLSLSTRSSVDRRTEPKQLPGGDSSMTYEAPSGLLCGAVAVTSANSSSETKIDQPDGLDSV